MNVTHELKRLRKAVTDRSPHFTPIAHYVCRVNNGRAEVLAGSYDLKTAVRTAHLVMAAKIDGDWQKLFDAAEKVMWCGDAVSVMQYGVDVLLFTMEQMACAIEEYNRRIDMIDAKTAMKG